MAPQGRSECPFASFEAMHRNRPETLAQELGPVCPVVLLQVATTRHLGIVVEQTEIASASGRSHVGFGRFVRFGTGAATQLESRAVKAVEAQKVPPEKRGGSSRFLPRTSNNDASG